MPITVSPKIKWSESLIQAALAHFFNWRVNLVFPNVQPWSWECDILLVTRAMKLWEVEVKTSLGDWKADALKGKWSHPNWSNISRFYYAIPKTLLIEEYGVWVPPTFVPEFAGLLTLEQHRDRVKVVEIRKPKTLGNYTLKPQKLTKLYRSAYFRYWATRKRPPDNLGFINCRDDDLLQLIAHVNPDPGLEANPIGYVIPKTAPGKPYVTG